MNFRIVDTFTDSLARLTSDEQKLVKTTAFDLQINPANPGMQFHRLDKAKDKDFWSVRVSGDLRLIVHKSLGSLLLCFVGHHDKAYEWAERRKLQTHPKTGAAQLVEIREGERQFPLLVDDADWSAAEARAVELIGESDASESAELLKALSFAEESHISDETTEKIVGIISAVLAAARDRWDSTQATLSASELKAYSDASLVLQRLPELPDLTKSWQFHASSAFDRVAAVEPDVDAIEEWIDFAEEIQRTEPRFLAKARFPADYEDKIERLLESAKSEIATEIESDDASDYQEQATRLSSLAASLSRLAGFLGADALRAKDIADRLEARASFLEDEAREREDEEEDHHSDDSDARRDDFDLRNIFVDL